MFSSNYQGGAVVEVFSGQGKDPVAKWKLSGGSSAIHKEYNKEVRGFVYCLDGSSQTVKMQIPENGKMSLGLLQRFLVLQVNIPQCKDFSIELVITDSEHLKRRLHLSTVHRELTVTLLHARIPFAGLKRDTWSTLCIDLVSFTTELFKGFLTLDGITLFATCKVRRIFTMKTGPTGMADDVMFLSGAGLMDVIPRSCQFPADVSHVTQMLNMTNLRTALARSDCAPDQSGTVRSTSYHQTRPQGVIHTASGSRAPAPPSQLGRKNRAASGSTKRAGHLNSSVRSPTDRANQKLFTESPSIANHSESLSHWEPSLTLQEGPPGRSQPQPPKDKQGSKKLRVLSAGKQRLGSSDAVAGGYRKSTTTRERCASPSRRQESRPQLLTPTDKTEPPVADEYSLSPGGERFRTAPTPAVSPPCSPRPVLSSDLQVWSSWESNEGSEPQLTLQEEMFIFSSQPHSPKRGQGQCDQEKMEMGGEQVQSMCGMRCEAQPEDDFIGSESDEDMGYTTMQTQRSDSTPATPRAPDPTSDVQLLVHPHTHNTDQFSPKELSSSVADIHIQSSSRGRAELSGMIPTCRLSPSVTTNKQGCKGVSHGPEVVSQVLDWKDRITLSRSCLQEVKLDDSHQHKEENKTLLPVDSTHYVLHQSRSLLTHGGDDDDEEELRMLASLKREQEEDECRASGLSASQMHQCDVSISMSSDDTSTWTHISMPANQGHHYQNEMNPLLHSNPREWMDVLSPPIMPPSQPRKSTNTRISQESLPGGDDESANEEENKDAYLSLLYDPCLNCYFDPKTGKYYELA